MKTKNTINMKFELKIIAFSVTCFLLWSCHTKKGPADSAYKLNQEATKLAPYDEGFPLTDQEVDSSAPYKSEDYIKYYSDFYTGKVAPGPFNYNIDLSSKSFNDLRLLRAEIFARHGYLFMDYVLRSYFNSTKWYQPVFWYPDFKIKLTGQEKSFIDKVLAYEQKLYTKNYVITENRKTVNLENVVNWQQFENIPPVMMQHLKQDGFVINQGSYGQLFHIYDENYYDYTPSFLTTDLFLQVMHMHLSKELQAIEEEKLISLLTDMTKELYSHAKASAAAAQNRSIQKAAEWNQVYYAVALSLATGSRQEVSAEWNQAFQTEYTHALEGQGRRSEFLGDSLMDYTQFQPRGNYTRTDTLKRYFKLVKWLNSASIYIDEDEGLIRAILMADGLLQSKNTLRDYTTFSVITDFLAGKENNLTFNHLLKILKESKRGNLEELLTKENLQKIRLKLYAADPKKMMPKGANERTDYFLARKKLLFTAGRYTFDGEILQRLVDIARPDLKMQPVRPFPKALDVFAAMGNKTAEDILLNVYKENENWKFYSDTLNVLKRKFQGFNDWDLSVYNKTMETVLSLQKPDAANPYYMLLPDWQKKDLNSMLASWTELKHDMVLYIEQPSGAEMGDGGEIPPPQKIAYVEPKVDFWSKCIDLLELNKRVLNENGLLTKSLNNRNQELSDLASFFLKISKKELDGKYLTKQEFDSLSYIGGEIERLTLHIIDSRELFISNVSTPERYLAIAADVYTYNDKCLEEAVGMGDEIYVIAEINGLLYLTRGAVFSHYEWKQPTANRLTDEAWQKQLLDGVVPVPAEWMNDIKISVDRVKTAPNFNLY
jgi:hypothetical protein